MVKLHLLNFQALYIMAGERLSTDMMAMDPSERAERIFKLLDTDKNGQISEEEFIRGSMQEPAIISMLCSTEDHMR